MKNPDDWSRDDISAMPTSILLAYMISPEKTLVNDLMEEIKKNANSPIGTPFKKVMDRHNEIMARISARTNRLLPIIAEEIDLRIPPRVAPSVKEKVNGK